MDGPQNLRELVDYSIGVLLWKRELEVNLLVERDPGDQLSDHVDPSHLVLEEFLNELNEGKSELTEHSDFIGQILSIDVEAVHEEVGHFEGSA